MIMKEMTSYKSWCKVNNLKPSYIKNLQKYFNKGE